MIHFWKISYFFSLFRRINIEKTKTVRPIRLPDKHHNWGRRDERSCVFVWMNALWIRWMAETLVLNFGSVKRTIYMHIWIQWAIAYVHFNLPVQWKRIFWIDSKNSWANHTKPNQTKTNWTEPNRQSTHAEAWFYHF